MPLAMRARLAVSVPAGSFWQPHNPPASEVVKWRALSGCCVATSLVACPGADPLWGGIGGDTATVCLA